MTLIRLFTSYYNEEQAEYWWVDDRQVCDTTTRIWLYGWLAEASKRKCLPAAIAPRLAKHPRSPKTTRDKPTQRHARVRREGGAAVSACPTLLLRPRLHRSFSCLRCDVRAVREAFQFLWWCCCCCCCCCCCYCYCYCCGAAVCIARIYEVRCR